MASKKTEGPKKAEFVCPECGKIFTRLLSAQLGREKHETLKAKVRD